MTSQRRSAVELLQLVAQLAAVAMLIGAISGALLGTMVVMVDLVGTRL